MPSRYFIKKQSKVLAWKRYENVNFLSQNSWYRVYVFNIQMVTFIHILHFLEKCALLEKSRKIPAYGTDVTREKLTCVDKAIEMNVISAIVFFLYKYNL